MKVAIWGYGWVGKAMKSLFPDAVVYDPGLTVNMAQIELVAGADIAFICVPTPNKDKNVPVLRINGYPAFRTLKVLDTSIVEDCVSKCDAKLIVIRSTVMPGTCDALIKKYNKEIVMQPEYLGETVNHPMLDPKARQFLILGGNSVNVRKLVDLYTTVYNADVKIRKVSCLEAEIIKLSENRAIAFKVAQCQELFDACEKAEVDYYTIRDAVYSDDPRFNLWWTFVFPEKRGFNSKCIPKDVYGWAAWAESLGYEPVITKAILERNEGWINGN